jgi:hypothetical protein
MPRVVKRSASQAVKEAPRCSRPNSPLPHGAKAHLQRCMRATNLGRQGGKGREGPEVPFGKQESSDQCQPVHAKNPQHGSPDSGPVAAQPARAPIATASSAMNNHRRLSPISEDPIR